MEHIKIIKLERLDCSNNDVVYVKVRYKDEKNRIVDRVGSWKGYNFEWSDNSETPTFQQSSIKSFIKSGSKEHDYTVEYNIESQEDIEFEPNSINTIHDLIDKIERLEINNKSYEAFMFATSLGMLFLICRALILWLGN